MLVALVGLCFAQTPGANFDCDMRKLAMTYGLDIVYEYRIIIMFLPVAKVIQPDLNQMDMQVINMAQVNLILKLST